MKFGEALHALQDNDESGISATIRRQSWNPDVEIFLQKPGIGSYMTAPYLSVQSLETDGESSTVFRRIPWIPNMYEMCVADDWEVVI